MAPFMYGNDLLLQVGSAGEQEFDAQRRVAFVLTAPERGMRQWAAIAHAAHLNTEMPRFQIDGYPVRLQHLHERGDDLLTQPFLYGEAPGKEAHQPGQFGDADNMLVRDVANVGIAMERQSVMFAEREEADRSLDHLAQVAIHVSPALGIEHFEELGIAIVAFRRLEESLEKAPRRFLRRRRVQVHAEGSKDFAHICLK